MVDRLGRQRDSLLSLLSLSISVKWAWPGLQMGVVGDNGVISPSIGVSLTSVDRGMR